MLSWVLVTERNPHRSRLSGHLPEQVWHYLGIADRRIGAGGLAGIPPLHQQGCGCPDAMDRYQGFTGLSVRVLM